MWCGCGTIGFWEREEHREQARVVLGWGTDKRGGGHNGEGGHGVCWTTRTNEQAHEGRHQQTGHDEGPMSAGRWSRRRGQGCSPRTTIVASTEHARELLRRMRTPGCLFVRTNRWLVSSCFTTQHQPQLLHYSTNEPVVGEAAVVGTGSPWPSAGDGAGVADGSRAFEPAPGTAATATTPNAAAPPAPEDGCPCSGEARAASSPGQSCGPTEISVGHHRPVGLGSAPST